MVTVSSNAHISLSLFPSLSLSLSLICDRGPRAATEAVLKHCTLQDVTFLRPLEIRGPISCLLGVLSTITDPLDCRHKDWVCVQGFVEAPTHVHR